MVTTCDKKSLPLIKKNTPYIYLIKNTSINKELSGVFIIDGTLFCMFCPRWNYARTIVSKHYIHIASSSLVRRSLQPNYTFFYKQLDLPSEPGVANENLENEAKIWLAVA